MTQIARIKNDDKINAPEMSNINILEWNSGLMVIIG